MIDWLFELHQGRQSLTEFLSPLPQELLSLFSSQFEFNLNKMPFASPELNSTQYLVNALRLGGRRLPFAGTKEFVAPVALLGMNFFDEPILLRNRKTALETANLEKILSGPTVTTERERLAAVASAGPTNGSSSVGGGVQIGSSQRMTIYGGSSSYNPASTTQTNTFEQPAPADQSATFAPPPSSAQADPPQSMQSSLGASSAATPAAASPPTAVLPAPPVAAKPVVPARRVSTPAPKQSLESGPAASPLVSEASAAEIEEAPAPEPEVSKPASSMRRTASKKVKNAESPSDAPPPYTPEEDAPPEHTEAPSEIPSPEPLPEAVSGSAPPATLPKPGKPKSRDTNTSSKRERKGTATDKPKRVAKKPESSSNRLSTKIDSGILAKKMDDRANQAKVVFDFEPENEGELACAKGEIVLVLDDVSDPDWALVRKEDSSTFGCVPKTFLKPIPQE